MRLSSFLRRKLIGLLSDQRIVVWYDGDGVFSEFIGAFAAPNTEMLSTEASLLRARRRADDVYRTMNESDDPAESGRSLLIYIPRRRGVGEDEKMLDPFEVYAAAGAAFGDTEGDQLESLARQAMPEKAEEITRLFREGRPDLPLLDGLEKAGSWPLVNEVFHTETPAEVIAAALCDPDAVKKVDNKPGCVEELLRFLEAGLGYKHQTAARKWKTIRPKAAEHVLFSEFLFDLQEGPPDSLSAVPRAVDEKKNLIFAACDRMRGDSSFAEEYVEAAMRVETDLRLPHLIPGDFNPGDRDTFPFEERRLLEIAVDDIVSDRPGAAQEVIQKRKQSIWRRDPRRSSAWTALERAQAVIESSKKVEDGLKDNSGLGALVEAYTEGNRSDLDRAARLFETAWTACPDEEVLDPVVNLCRHRYRETVTLMQHAFLSAVQTEGWPADGVPRQTRIFADHVEPLLERRKRTAYFLVDSLRYEMGRDVAEVLAEVGDVEISHAAAVVPTVTGCGMAALMPGADGVLRLTERKGELIPALGTRLLKTSADRMKLLSGIFGDRFFETTLDDLLGEPKKTAAKLKDTELFVVRTQDPDAVAENLGPWRARKYLSDVIGDIAFAARWVADQEFNHVVIVSDHGHMMLPEIAPGDVVQTPPGDWPVAKRRCRLGAGLSLSDGTLTLKAGHLGVQGDVEDVCLPIGLRVFSDGDPYFHGGLSLQEAVVPVVVLKTARETPTAPSRTDIGIRYRSDKFTSRVIGLQLLLQGDLFGNAARVRVEAYDGAGAKAKLVGEAADCEARDEKTREVTLEPDGETPVPVLIEPDFDGPGVEIRVSDPETRVVWARRKLKNAMLD